MPDAAVPVAGRLALESGAVFEGVLFGAVPGADGVSGEVVFNTCMTGYQEVASDPSYAGQIVVMTYPLIGNYGCTDGTLESWRVHARAMVVRELSPQVGHPRGERTLSDELARWGVPGIAGVDTRALTRHLREHGTLRGVIAPSSAMSAAEQVARAAAAPWVSDEDLVGQTSLAAPFESYDEALDETLERAVRLSGNVGRYAGTRVVVLDYGVKRNMLRAVRSRGASVIVLRQDATIEDVLAQSPHGVILSNGPGDPARIPHAVRLCQGLLERRVPLLGICLGHRRRLRHLAEPRVPGGCGFDPRGIGLVRQRAQPQRRQRRGPAPPHATGVLGAVPPRRCAGTAGPRPRLRRVPRHVQRAPHRRPTFRKP